MVLGASTHSSAGAHQVELGQAGPWSHEAGPAALLGPGVHSPAHLLMFVRSAVHGAPDLKELTSWSERQMGRRSTYGWAF